MAAAENQNTSVARRYCRTFRQSIDTLVSFWVHPLVFWCSCLFSVSPPFTPLPTTIRPSRYLRTHHMPTKCTDFTSVDQPTQTIRTLLLMCIIKRNTELLQAANICTSVATSSLSWVAREAFALLEQPKQNTAIATIVAPLMYPLD